MKRYWYTLMDDNNEDLGVCIPDGWHKQVAINFAKRWMQEMAVQNAYLSINSMATNNLLDVIPIEL